MVSLTSILAMATLVATTVDYVKAHGYIKEPPCSFVENNKENSDWITEAEPLWKGEWATCKNDEDMLAMFKKLGAANNYKDIRTLMDGNPAFGKDCGYTDLKAKPVAPPSNGQATLSRAIVHAGPCAIYLDNKMVFQSDDCQSSNGDGIFEPVDYSSCAPGGCILRFYWLALQRLEGKTLWQSYKNCIPLSGPSGGGGTDDVSQEELSGNSNNSQNTTNSKSEDTPANKSEDSPTIAPARDSPKTPESPSAYSPDTPAMTPAPGSKCKGHRRRRY